MVVSDYVLCKEFNSESVGNMLTLPFLLSLTS